MPHIDISYEQLPDVLTLRRGSSPTDARFFGAAYATSPRRRCPSLSLFLAAL
jgi:hypothetical protein